MNISLIVAAGESKRMGSKIHKLLLPVLGKPILYYTIASFYDHPDVERIVVVVNKKIRKKVEKLVKEYFPGRTQMIRITVGGKNRPESVLKGLKYIDKYFKPKQKDILLIHNGANPLVSFEEIDKSIKTAKSKGACIVAHSMNDTLKEIKRKKIVKTHKRENFVRAQTPQTFQYAVFKKALAKVGKDYLKMTDEASLVEETDMHVAHVEASDKNVKMTTQADYEHIRTMLGDLPDSFVVGIGQDSHAFSEKKGLVLAGLEFPNENKLSANSDGDVLIHALCNGLLQAIGNKSLGSFADDLCLKKNIKDSRKYLAKILKKVARKGYELNNIGCMIEAKRPKIDAISPRLKTNLAQLTGLDIKKIGITATSGEKLTSFGKGKGIQCFCIVSLKKT